MGRVSQVHIITLCGFKNVYLSPKVAKIGNFWNKFAQNRYIPLSNFLQNLALARVLQVCTLTPNFTAVALKMWAYSLLNRQNWYFLVQICPKVWKDQP